jgi:transportin-3
MVSWQNVVQGFLADFGQDVAMVPALLEFLRVLPEEAGNPKIVVASAEMESRLGDMLGSSAQEVLNLLGMYIGAPGTCSCL